MLQEQITKVEAEVKARQATAVLLATVPGLAAFGSLAWPAGPMTSNASSGRGAWRTTGD